MFVTRNIYNAACRERDEALDLVAKLRAMLAQTERSLFNTTDTLNQEGRQLDERTVELVAAIAERDAARAELAKTYVRDAKGRMARHPSSVATIVDGAAPSRAILDSCLNKDRSGKHGSEVA